MCEMGDQDKKKEQLTSELAQMWRHIYKLARSETKCQQSGVEKTTSVAKVIGAMGSGVI